ncbi:hypothetical protein GALMADRAFT_252156 [Galerina marginata CBS 339.88]|uniref:DUF6699 domain-containing protein n=1 Tax=Galerina marginata (strain CBS 339.88) TaxID=685588 RepID=A0A067SYT4_GALM3|nr:hypothetical protein GALMADRAFT_252156 [Galerina marginata CBS 339.88]
MPVRIKVNFIRFRKHISPSLAPNHILTITYRSSYATMPGKHVKHVHFSTSPSSPASSSSSLSSTEETMTPPPLGFGSPYHCSPLPGNALANPVLTVSKTPLIEYNLSEPPTAIIPLMHPVPSNLLEQPATQPLFPFIDVVCPRLPWRITIHSHSKPYVTVGDVLDGLHRALRTNVTPAEFALLPSDEAKRDVTNAYKVRYKSISDPEEYHVEKAKGVKRVDFLGKYNIFRGIVCTKDGLDGWTLMLSSSSLS